MNFYSVKVKITNPTFKNTYVNGLVIAKTPTTAKELALKEVVKGVVKGVDLGSLGIKIESTKFEVTDCKKIKSDFVIDGRNSTKQ